MATGRIPTTANSPLTVKGDLFGYSTTQARVPVGNDGETLVADSSTSIGLRYQGNFAAGKNKIINGDFGIWQRGTSFSSPSDDTYSSADRWKVSRDGSPTFTVSQQAATPAAITGYDPQYYLRYNVTSLGGATSFGARQRIEDVRTLAGQAVTVSFWVKSDATRAITFYWQQNFGSGGSTTVTSSAISIGNATTSWTRLTSTFTLDSISGKTIGAGSYLAAIILLPGATQTTDIWGVQLEAGSTATAFQTATGTIQGELLACMRYYYLLVRGNGNYIPFSNGYQFTSTQVTGITPFPVAMRTAPTLDMSGGTDYYLFSRNGANDFWNTCISDGSSTTTGAITVTSNISGTAGQGGAFYSATANTGTGYIAWSAEL
jgi:hypothetical protein